MCPLDDIHAPAVCDEDLDAALIAVADLLGADVTWLYRGAYHFVLPGEAVTVAISADSAGRLRVDSCVGTEPRSTVWVRAGDYDRLASVVAEMWAGVPA